MKAAQRAREGARPAWVRQRERGQTLAIRLIVWIALTFGRRFARSLLYPICLYFLVFSVSARRASASYLRRALDREPRWRDLFRHYHTFASTILDRVFFLHGQYRRFDVRVEGEKRLRELMSDGGCLLLGAHLGSFEVIRSLGHEAGGCRISMVMYEDNARKLSSVLAAINPRVVLDVIPLGHVDSMLKVEQAVARGELVGILADRLIAGDGTATRSFLGAPARIPVGPFRVAAMLKRPVILMFGIYHGGNRYSIHFEELVDLRDVDRRQREAVLDVAMSNYVKRVEHYCRTAPYNWFNFYDYWA